MISRTRSYNPRLKSKKKCRKISLNKKGGKGGTGKSKKPRYCEKRIIQNDSEDEYDNDRLECIGKHCSIETYYEYNNGRKLENKRCIYSTINPIYDGSINDYLGKSLSELKYISKLSLNQFKDGFSFGDIKKSGLYTNIELKEAGYTAKDFRDLMKEKVKTGLQYSSTQFINKTIKKLLDANFTLLELKIGGFTATEFKIGDLKANQLLDIGFTFLELIEAGYKATELKSSGLDVKQLTPNFFGELFKNNIVEQLYHLDFTINDLKNNGYTLVELLKGGYNKIKCASVELDIKGLNRYDFNEWNLTPIQTIVKLKELLFTAKDLLDMEFTLVELIIAGYNSNDLATENITIEGLNRYHFNDWKLTPIQTIVKLKELGFTAKDLHNMKFTFQELIESNNLFFMKSGFYLHELINLGLTATQAKEIQNNIRIEKIKQELNLQNLVKLQFRLNDDPVVLPENQIKYSLEDLKGSGYDLVNDDNYNLYHIFLSGKYTYGEITKIYTILKKEKNSDQLKEIKKSIDIVKKSCINPEKYGIFNQRTRTNPSCKLKYIIDMNNDCKKFYTDILNENLEYQLDNTEENRKKCYKKNPITNMPRKHEVIERWGASI